MDSKNDFNKLFVSFASKLEKIKADDGEESNGEDKYKRVCQEMYYYIENLHKRIDSLSSSFYDYAYKHNQGHVPPIKTAGQMQKVIKALGLDADYDVQKPTIYVNASEKNGLLIEASYKKQ